MSQPELTEEQLRQLEAEMERITVDDVLLQTTVTLLNLAARKSGLGAPPDQAPPADWEQVRQAIEGVRALLPMLEQRHAEQLGPVRETLSRLQLVYAQSARGGASEPPPEGGGGAGEPEPAQEQEQQPSGPGPAQSSGRLWIPGQ
jgi:hypothetical protein